MRHVFIINPMAGRRDSRERLLKRLEQEFSRGEYQVCLTRARGDARQLAQEAVDRGEPVRLYACGGDGTLNEVVNAAAGRSHAAVTNVPMGTGNDFLRIFGRQGRKRFADLAALRDGPQAAFDLMDCNGLLGLNVVCAGIDARVADDVHRFKRLPLIVGTGAYVLSLIHKVGQGLSQPMEIRAGQLHCRGPITIVCICNGRFYGGGFCPVPEAMPDDGVLDMLVVGDLTRRRFARYVGKYAAGKYRQCPPDIVTAYHGQEVSICSQEELTVVVDGESLYGRQFTIRLSERKVNFFYPQDVSYSAGLSVP